MPNESQRGFWAVLLAFLVWGVFPIFWHALRSVPALQLMTHRLTWCFVFVVGYLVLSRGPRWWRAIAADRRLLTLLTTSSVLIALNWWLYIWAVNADHIVEASLGYFINPLVNVLLGVLVLRERLNGRQWLAVAIAGAGVAYLTVDAGTLPWIALALAVSFSLYGLIRKLAVVDALAGLGVENSVLIVPALAYLAAAHATGKGAFGHEGLPTDLLIVSSGIVTALPLVLFAYGARRIAFSTVGIVQYVSPTLQLACGVLIFREPFTQAQAVAFGAIWVALVVYAADGVLRASAIRAGRT